MFAWLAGVSLLGVLLLIWSALYQQGLLWGSGDAQLKETARFDAPEADAGSNEAESIVKAVTANSSGN